MRNKNFFAVLRFEIAFEIDAFRFNLFSILCENFRVARMIFLLSALDMTSKASSAVV